MKNNLNLLNEDSLQYKLPTMLVPSSYPLYIKSGIRYLSGLIILDSPSGAAANHPYAMDRRNHGLDISLMLIISRDIAQNRVTHSFRVTIPYSLSSTGISLNSILIPLLISE